MNPDEGDSKKENCNNLFDGRNVFQSYGIRCVNEDALEWWDVILECNLIILPIVSLFLWAVFLLF